MPKTNEQPDERTIPVTEETDQPRSPDDHRTLPMPKLAEPGAKDQTPEPRADDLAAEAQGSGTVQAPEEPPPAPPAPPVMLAEDQAMTLEEFMATHYGDYGQTLMGGWVNWRRANGMLSDKEDALLRSFKAYINRPAG